MLNQKNIILGFKALETKGNISLPAFTAFKLYKFKKQLKECYDWQAEEERRIFEEYGATFEEGKLTLEDPGKSKEFTDAISALSKVEHEELNKMEIPVSVFGELTMEDIEDLENIFEFTE